MEHSESVQKIAAALVAVQAKLKPLRRNADIMIAFDYNALDQVDEARAALKRVIRKNPKDKEALNGLEARDVDRGYRWEQGFTLEMYMHEDSQRARDAFVETGKAASF